MLTLPEHLISHPVFSEVRVARSLVFCVMFRTSLFVLLTIVLSVFLQFIDSDYPFGIYILFLTYLSQFSKTGCQSKIKYGSH
jgi:hypothetical protein